MVIQHISAEEVDESEDESAPPNLKPSVFDRLQLSISKKCQSGSPVYGKGKTTNSLFLIELKMFPSQSVKFLLE